MNWKNKKVLVTGAGGFIGSHLVETLAGMGAKVTAMLRYSSRSDWGNLEFLPDALKKKLNVISGNVEDPFFVRTAVKKQDVVFHLAALIGIPHSYIAPASYVRTNVEGTTNVMQACLEEKVGRVIHTSTSESYGTARYTPIDEAHPLSGQSPYSASKIGADKIAESYYLAFGLPVATIRPFNTFGPRQSARAVIPTIVSQALSRKQIKLGSLSPVRDLTYVGDTVRGFIKMAESGKAVGRTINIGSGKGIGIGELAKKIISMLGKKVKIVADRERVRPENSEVLELICNNQLANDVVGWRPERSLSDGLRETISFVRDNPDFYKPDIYNV